MPNYKEMYLKMMRASEKALRQMEAASSELIAAQRACEELYLSAPEPELKVLPLDSKEGSTPLKAFPSGEGGSPKG